MSEDSGLGRATPPRRAPSPGMARHLPSPSGPGSLPPGLFSKRKQAGFDDAASDISSTASSTADYLGKYSFHSLWSRRKWCMKSMREGLLNPPPFFQDLITGANQEFSAYFYCCYAIFICYLADLTIPNRSKVI